MTFRVDPAALRKAAELLERNGNAYESISGFLNKEIGIPGVAEGLVDGQGLVGIFQLKHEELQRDGDRRLMLARAAYLSAWFQFDEAARGYVESDRAAAARQDALLRSPKEPPRVEPDPDRWPSEDVAGWAAVFADVGDPLERLHVASVDVEALEPKVHALAEFSGWLSDHVSQNWYVRAFLKRLFGRDPFEELIQAFVGDWKVLAEYAAVWKRTGMAVDCCARNIEYVDDALSASWDGKAADLAFVYLQELHAATGAEADFCGEYAYRMCVAHVEIAYWGYERINYMVGDLLDLVLSSALGGGTGIATAGQGTKAAAVVAVVDKIIFYADLVRQVYMTWKLGEAIVSIPDEPPPSKMADLRLVPDNSAAGTIVAPRRYW